MRFSSLAIIFLISVFILVGCSEKTSKNSVPTDADVSKATSKEESTKNPTLHNILAENSEADIIYFNNIVFMNAENLEWVQELDMTLGEEVTVIKKQSKKSTAFIDGTATKLPIGTKIYKLANHPGPVYIAVLGEDKIAYLGLYE